MPVEVGRAIEGLRQEGELKIFVSLLRQGIISEDVVLVKVSTLSITL